MSRFYGRSEVRYPVSGAPLKRSHVENSLEDTYPQRGHRIPQRCVGVPSIVSQFWSFAVMVILLSYHHYPSLQSRNCIP